MTQYKKPNVKALRAKQKVSSFVGLIAKIVVCIIFLFPFYWMVITSFKTFAESVQIPPTLWPQEFTIEAYIKVFEKMNIGSYIGNTIFLMVVVTSLRILIMVPAAYAFARYKFKGKDIMFGFLMVAFMVPTCLTFVTIYRLFADSTMMDSFLPQILPCICDAFGIFLLRQCFMQVPDELVEAAKLDEANELQVVTKIMLPMAKSTMSTILFLSIIGTWNSYFWPLVMTINDKYRPITIAIEKLKSLDSGLVWPTVMAGNMILLAPVIIVFLIASKKIIAAMAYRGVK